MPDTIAAPLEMPADSFLPWSLAQAEGRWELHDGKVVRMPAERAVHARLKGEIFVRLREAVRQADGELEAFTDSLAVRVDERTVFEPDALVRGGPRLAGDAYVIDDPVIVVEITSRFTERIDTLRKLPGYFRLAAVQHFLIIDPEQRIILHHARDGADIRTRILHGGSLRLDPPGLTFDLAAIFEPIG